MFVRTKTGIYEDLTTGYCGMIHFCNNGIRVAEEDIIKQADTIEELCDGYYLYNGYDDKFNPDRIYTTDEKAKALDDCKDLAFHIDLMCRGRYICELRAFIETDKGLIFIGKFNENEKLVLI